MTTDARTLGRFLGRTDAAVSAWEDARYAERLEVDRAARLLAPKLSFISTDNEWIARAEVTMPSGTPTWAMRLYPLPPAGTPEVLTWRWFDGMRETDEPVAKLIRMTGSGAVYGLANTRAARDFGNLLGDMDTAIVRSRPPDLDGRSSRVADVIFE